MDLLTPVVFLLLLLVVLIVGIATTFVFVVQHFPIATAGVVTLILFFIFRNKGKK